MANTPVTRVNDRGRKEALVSCPHDGCDAEPRWVLFTTNPGTSNTKRLCSSHRRQTTNIIINHYTHKKLE